MAFDFRYPKPCAPNNTSPTRFRVPRTKGEFMYRTSFRLWLLGSVAAFAALGQAINGSFSGIVTDKSGSTIPEAKITVTDLDRNTAFTSVSNETGFYVVSPLPIGRYRIAAEKSGFRQYVLEGFPLSAEQKASVN